MSTDSIQIRDGLIIIDHNNDWTEFKKWINGTYANLRYVWGRFGNGFMDSIYEDATISSYQDERCFYKVVAIDDKVIRTVVIYIVKPKSAAQIDFEDNFMSDILPVREEYDNGELFETRYNGYLYTCESGQSTHEIKLSKSVHLEGLRYWTQNSTVGDTISFSVVDKDNVFGFGANYIFDDVIVDSPIVPSSYGQQEFSFNKTYINANLYLRVEYFNSSGTEAKLGITYKWLETAN
jgi:hypothetical protein